MKDNFQPWLSSPLKDSSLILAPAIVPVVIVFLFQGYFQDQSEVSSIWWIVLVLCIDVSHVYSTLFRLYWDKSTFDTYRKLLLLIPCLTFGAGFFLHMYSSSLFWRVLAYIAVFHFIRQQYGFMRLYSRTEVSNKLIRTIDTVAIYNATLYPLLYWHINLTQDLSWFVKNDFIKLNVYGLDGTLKFIFIAIASLYVVKELLLSYRKSHFNIPKNMIMLGTYMSWYVGIISFHGDLIFTLLNVVAHGVPYMGLIWIYGEHKSNGKFSFSWKGASIFLAVLLTFAYFEETLWDILVWKDHTDLFPFLTEYSALQSPLVLSVIVPLLVIPQVTHYILDGFIWRFSKQSPSRIQ